MGWRCTQPYPSPPAGGVPDSVDILHDPHPRHMEGGLYHTQHSLSHPNFMFQNIRIFVWPWVVCTVLATVVETMIDVWILSKVDSH